MKGKGQVVHSEQPKDSLAMPRQEGCVGGVRHNTSSPSWIRILRGSVQQKRGSQSYHYLAKGLGQPVPLSGSSFLHLQRVELFLPRQVVGAQSHLAFTQFLEHDWTKSTAVMATLHGGARVGQRSNQHFPVSRRRSVCVTDKYLL